MKGDICYLAIQEFYKNKVSKRSKIPYMLHIDEGLIILEYLGCNVRTMKGYCLHPLFQTDKDLVDNRFIPEDYNLGYYPVMLAMEYRHIANSYLSTRKINDIDEIQLSPLPEVNDMLRADKIQNYVEFRLNHKDHPRKIELNNYFMNWLDKLKIEYQTFLELEKMLLSRRMK